MDQMNPRLVVAKLEEELARMEASHGRDPKPNRIKDSLEKMRLHRKKLAAAKEVVAALGTYRGLPGHMDHGPRTVAIVAENLRNV